MFVRPFRYVRAETAAEACELLRRHEGSKLLAGGQSLLPMINAGLAEPEMLVDISHIDSMAGISGKPGYLEIGALTRHETIASNPAVRAHQPLLAAAAAHIGNVRVRNRGTIGGSLAHADPAAELPLVLTALGATIVSTDGGAVREVKAEELAQSFLSTQLADDEIITRVDVPVLGPGWGWSFLELARRQGDFCIVAVAVLVRVVEDCAVESRIAAAGIASRAVRLGALETALSGATRTECAQRVEDVREVDVLSDSTASATYRRHVLATLVRRGVDEAFARAAQT
jgi:CO/xanthine dehydrogenase FAD-binding subunit